MSNNTISAILVIVLIAVALGLMVLGWRRGKRSVSLPPLPDAPADLGAIAGEFRGLYLSTTPVDEPLRRVTSRGLGFRERGVLTVAATGFLLPGERFLPADSVIDVSRASWTIDRGVEANGLNVITWTLGESTLNSYFRLDDPEGFDAATTTYRTKTGQK